MQLRRDCRGAKCELVRQVVADRFGEGPPVLVFERLAIDDRRGVMYHGCGGSATSACPDGCRLSLLVLNASGSDQA